MARTEICRNDLLDSFDLIRCPGKVYLVQTTTFPLTVALPAMRLETDIRIARERLEATASGCWILVVHLHILLAVAELVFSWERRTQCWP